MLEKSKKEEASKPLFAYFLSIKAFLVLYLTGFLAMFGWVHMSLTIDDAASVTSSQIALVIYIFLAPSVYILAKKIFAEFEELFKEVHNKKNKRQKRASFPESKELGFLFLKESKFKRYRKEVHRRVNNKKEKITVTGLGLIFLPLNFLQDYQRNFYSAMFHQSWFSLSVVEYFGYILYWVVIYALLFSVIWMILTVTHALLRLNKEKQYLHITNRIDELASSYKQLEKNGLPKSEIRILDLSFKRFTAGLSTIANFVLSLSLKIAFVGGISAIPAIIYFVTTRRIVAVWYGACIMACSLSLIVFILGQYGAWKLWSEAKNNVNKLLNATCAKITEISLDQSIPEDSKKKLEIDPDCVNQTMSIINKTVPVTYTSSAIFKIVSANFLAFGPIIIEQVVFRLILK